MEAVAQAAFADDLERMSQGMDTMIGEKGVSVSGGQNSGSRWHVLFKGCGSLAVR